MSTFSDRRSFLCGTLSGVASIALTDLLARDGFAQTSDRWNGAVRPLHYRPRARRIVHLCMAGGPSHLELLDGDKPELVRLDGEPMPESVTQGKPIAQLQGAKLRCLKPQHAMKTWGRSGQRISEILPHIGGVADDICIVRSMQTDQINHDPAHTLFNTGTPIPGRPSLGSWLLYGLGAECDDLPGYIVLTSSGGGQDQPIASRQWHSGFLPGRFQGVQFNSQGDPVHYVRNPAGVSREQQRSLVDAVRAIDELSGRAAPDPEIETRIAQYELAFRMQASVPELMDLKGESPEVLEMYGAKPGDGSFATNCLLARRLLERGVRFVQLYHRGWDHHGGVKNGTKYTAGLVDQASAALVRDLRQRGLLEDTLVIWGGEFGRTPMAQGSGRDHHIRGYSGWLAGGGIQGGTSYGQTDEFGYEAVENVVHVRDLHATILHQFGIDAERLSVKFQGLDHRLTGVTEPARVVREILA